MSPKSGPKYIFSFGDSYTSTNFDINGPQPCPENPLGNTDLGNHQTSAQGPVWIEFLTTKYNTDPVLTYNFAVGGASIPDNYTYQVENLYQPKYTRERFWHGSQTLFTSWIGINDVSDAWIHKDMSMLLRRLDQYTDLLEQLWDTGARNFLIVNNPPLDRSPFIQGGDEKSIAHYAACIKVFNDNLPKHVVAFQDKHPDGTVLLYDVHKFFSKVLDDPKAYGFKDNISEDEDGCMWSGSFHIRTGLDDVIAMDMAKTVAKFSFIA
ncbi:cellulose-binding GDSL lipase/acylhydrolase [Rhexocercosporidium sp. MPI-PUGE-AT-0058]|nr:cellulose-binding GDSL lipase/acylhydrolase [Rhexocercosporidium sp. MPI-PUGE-AT-0058]